MVVVKCLLSFHNVFFLSKFKGIEVNQQVAEPMTSFSFPILLVIRWAEKTVSEINLEKEWKSTPCLLKLPD